MSTSDPPLEHSDLGRQGPRRWRAAVSCLAYALIGLAVLSGFMYVHAFGVNLYLLDEWDVLPPLFERHAAGMLTLGDFWQQHNEHRLLFPELAMFGLGWLTRGDTVTNMYVSQGLLAAMLAVYLAAFGREFRSGWTAWALVPVAFLVFSLRQAENMLWGFQLGFFLVMAAALAAFCV